MAKPIDTGKAIAKLQIHRLDFKPKCPQSVKSGNWRCPCRQESASKETRPFLNDAAVITSNGPTVNTDVPLRAPVLVTPLFTPPPLEVGIIEPFLGALTYGRYELLEQAFFQ
jgi:hypothetical protein